MSGRRRLVLCAAVLLGAVILLGDGLTGAAPEPSRPEVPEIVKRTKLPKSLFESVTANPSLLKDRKQAERIGIRREEDAAYNIGLAAARDADQIELRKAALAWQKYRKRVLPHYQKYPESLFAAYADIVNKPLRPELYQGIPVRLHGRVQDWKEYPANNNEHGLDTLYEVWLYDYDAQNNPAVIICTELPEGFPAPGERIEGVTVVGYFFKIYGYAARNDTVRYAPLLLAKTVDWSSEPFETAEIPAWVTPTIIGLLVLVAVTIWWTNRTQRRRSSARRSRLRDDFELPPEIELPAPPD